MPVILGVIAFFAVVAFIIAAKGAATIRPYQKGIVERVGKYQRTVDGGLTIIIPFLEKITKVDMREQVVNVPPQIVTTRDNAAVEVSAVIYYEVTDPMKVIYNISNFDLAVTELAQITLHNLIGGLAPDESLTSREKINRALREVLDEAADKWGARVIRVELQRIEPTSRMN